MLKLTKEEVEMLMREVCDKDKVDAYFNGFWTITQEELERFADRVIVYWKETEG